MAKSWPVFNTNLTGTAATTNTVYGWWDNNTVTTPTLIKTPNYLDINRVKAEVIEAKPKPKKPESPLDWLHAQVDAVVALGTLSP